MVATSTIKKNEVPLPGKRGTVSPIPKNYNKKTSPYALIAVTGGEIHEEISSRLPLS